MNIKAKDIRRTIIFLLGLFSIRSGINVMDTGILIYAPERAGVIVQVGELSDIFGWLEIALGVVVCSIVLLDLKGKAL